MPHLGGLRVLTGDSTIIYLRVTGEMRKALKPEREDHLPEATPPARPDQQGFEASLPFLAQEQWVRSESVLRWERLGGCCAGSSPRAFLLTPLTGAFMLLPLLSSHLAAVSRARAGKGWGPGTCQDPETQSWVLGL